MMSMTLITTIIISVVVNFTGKSVVGPILRDQNAKKNLLIEIVISQAYQRTEGGKFTNSKGFYTRLLSFTTLAFFFTRHDWRGEHTSAWLSKVACWRCVTISMYHILSNRRPPDISTPAFSTPCNFDRAAFSAYPAKVSNGKFFFPFLFISLFHIATSLIVCWIQFFICLKFPIFHILSTILRSSQARLQVCTHDCYYWLCYAMLL